MGMGAWSPDKVSTYNLEDPPMRDTNTVLFDGTTEDKAGWVALRCALHEQLLTLQRNCQGCRLLDWCCAAAQHRDKVAGVLTVLCMCAGGHGGD